MIIKNVRTASHPNVRARNLVQKRRRGNCKPETEHTKSEVQKSMCVKKPTMKYRLSNRRSPVLL